MQALVVYAETLHAAREEIFDQNIAPSSQALHQFTAFGVTKVNGDALFPAIDAAKISAFDPF